MKNVNVGRNVEDASSTFGNDINPLENWVSDPGDYRKRGGSRGRRTDALPGCPSGRSVSQRDMDDAQF